MREHHWCEVLGFWLEIGGMTICLIMLLIIHRHGRERESRTEMKTWQIILIFLMPAIAGLSLCIGFHLMCIGGHGQYPPYPLDVFLELWK
jgi:hypothetical protein